MTSWLIMLGIVSVTAWLTILNLCSSRRRCSRRRKTVAGHRQAAVAGMTHHPIDGESDDDDD